MYLTKAETWRMAKQLNCPDVIINDTLTDYNGSMVKTNGGYGVTTTSNKFKSDWIL